MIFNTELVPGKLIKRYKRFLADVALDTGETITVYCPNTGSMRTCSAPGSRVCLSRSANEKRKYPYTLEMVEGDGGWVGVNTGLTNQIVAEAIESGLISRFSRVDRIRKEVKVSAGSRLDLLVEGGGESTYVEIKNCSMAEEGVAMFPDAVTARGTRHLHELAAIRRRGDRAVIFYLVQRMDAHMFKPAAHIDPEYAATLAEAHRFGVEILVYRARVSPEGITVCGSLPFSLV